ncbi:hypothetical protein MACH10_10590 [Thalassospira tepidiphila]|uniref:hypothetical protein n=1 Tax=Thalassospira tepidiphila TaxID=393657 RepID=UPI002923E0E1|nr:hypothetical protein MACH10_10590 [Thalassospira tepidiphila]
MGGLLILGVMIGWTLPFFYQLGIRVNLTPPVGVEISFVDLVLISLTAVTVMLAILGIGIAVLAFFGSRTIAKKAEEIAQAEIQKSLEQKGKITTTVNNAVISIAEGYLSKELVDGGKITEIIEKQVANVAYSGVNQPLDELEDDDDDSDDR